MKTTLLQRLSGLGVLTLALAACNNDPLPMAPHGSAPELAAATAATTTFTVAFGARGTIIADRAVEVTVDLNCPRGYQVVEGTIHVTQRNNSAFGQIPAPTCDGTARRYKVKVVVHDPRYSFRAGSAFASAYVEIVPTTGKVSVRSASANRWITLVR